MTQNDAKNQATIARRDVLTTFNYHTGDEPPPPIIVSDPSTFSFPQVAIDTIVHDITGDESSFTLDDNGFCIIQHESKFTVTDYLNDEMVKAEYYPEIEQLIKDLTGANRIFIFDHTIRQYAAGADETKSNITGEPVMRVHLDQSYAGSVERVRYHLPDEAAALLENRFQIINVWRPIKTIYRQPLAVADAKSVADSDLVPAAFVYPHRTGEVYAVRHSASHRWYYKYAQQPDEPLLFKLYDSLDDGRARRVPHSAFVSATEEGKPPRESIEVRCLVFYA